MEDLAGKEKFSKFRYWALLAAAHVGAIFACGGVGAKQPLAITLRLIVKAGRHIHSVHGLTASSSVLHRLFSAMRWWACGIVFMTGSGLAETTQSEATAPTVIRVTGYTPWAWSPPTRARRSALQTFMNDTIDPGTGQPWGKLIRIEPDNPLSFPGFSLKILNFSAGTGEEVVTTSQGITQFYQYRDQRCLMPVH